MNQTEQQAGSLSARIDGIDVAQLLRNLEQSSMNEGSDDLYCRCMDALTVLRHLAAQHDETLALHRQLVGEKLRADQGWARAAAKSRECIELRERIAAGGDGEMHANLLTSSPPPAHAVAGGQPVTVGFDDLMALARSLIAEQLDDVDEEFMAGRAHGIGSLHSEILMLAKSGVAAQAQDEKDASKAGYIEAPPQGGANPAPPSDQLAFELPTGAQVIRNVGRNHSPENSGQPSELARQALNAADVDQNILSVALWLYRRLSPGYGRPPHVEGPIKALARRVGTDVADCLAERGPDPAAGGDQ
jgi:hypothetical protein